MIKFSSLKYNHSRNLGDEIQSIAAEQFLSPIDIHLNRESLGSVSTEEKYLLIMNGWFAHCPAECFPPSDAIIPIFIGFHITNMNDTASEFLKPEGIEYFKRYEPIGCRDRKTMELLSNKGIDAFYSKCLTLTFPNRKQEPRNGKVFLVDTDYIPIPGFLQKHAIPITHLTHKKLKLKAKKQKATELLRMYRDNARLVITTRLHCALPCVGMGIPVIFFGNPKDYRLSVLEDLGIKINSLPKRWISRVYKFFKIIFLDKLFAKLAIKLIYKDVDWNPKTINIEKEKEELIKITTELLKDRITRLEIKK